MNRRERALRTIAAINDLDTSFFSFTPDIDTKLLAEMMNYIEAHLDEFLTQ